MLTFIYLKVNRPLERYHSSVVRPILGANQRQKETSSDWRTNISARQLPLGNRLIVTIREC